MATTSTQFVTWEGLQYFAEQFSKTNIAAMNVTTIVTNILSTHDNNTIPTTQAVYEYAAAAVDLNNDVTYTLGMTNTSASLATLRNRSTSTAIHPETEAAAVLTNTPGKTLAKALSSGVSYTEGPTGGVSTDNLSGYYSKTQVDELLDEKEDKPNIGSFPIFLDLSQEADDVVFQGKLPGANWGPNSPSQNLQNTANILNWFATGAQVFETGKTYMCFYAQGVTAAGGDGRIHALLFTVNSDGSSIVLKNDYSLPFGSKIVTPRSAHYQPIKMPTSPSDTIFSDYIAVTSGKWPIIRQIDGTTWFQNLRNCEVHLIFATSRASCAIGFLDCYNLSVLTDTSAMPVDSSHSTFVDLYLRRNNLRFLPIGSTYFGARTPADTATANQQIAIVTGTGSSGYHVSNITLEGTLGYRPSYYSDEDGGAGFMVIPVRTRLTNYWKTDDGKKILRLDPVIEFINYSAAWTSTPQLEDVNEN